MSNASLQITYRKGRPFAAYLSVGAGRDRHVASSRERGPVVVDFDAAGNVLGFELHTITKEGVTRLKQELIALKLSELADEDLAPLLAA